MKNIKLMATLLLILVQVLCIVSCKSNDKLNLENQNLGATNDQLKKFVAHIIDNEYLKYQPT